MAGIFSVTNRPNTTENERTLSAHFVAGVLIRKSLNLSTNQQLLDAINLELGASGPLDAQAAADFLALVGWVAAGANNDIKSARLGLITHMFALYELSQPDGTPWLTEAECKLAFETAGVVFT